MELNKIFMLNDLTNEIVLIEAFKAIENGLIVILTAKPNFVHMRLINDNEFGFEVLSDKLVNVNFKLSDKIN